MWSSRTGLNVVQKSDQQIAAAKKDAKLSKLNGLPFDSIFSTSFASSLEVAPGLFDNISIVNSSAAAYNFTSLTVYDDVDPAFFTPAAFDSAQAIASGTLILDQLATFSTLDVGANTSVGVGVGPLDPAGYVLMLGTSRQIISPGVFGQPVNFSFAETLSVPSPGASVFLVTGAIALVAVHGWRRRKVTTA
jgi:hypothetical protein